MSDRTNCPHCNAFLRGEAIPEEYLCAGYYGPWDGVTPQYFKRTIGIEVMGLYDGVAYWRCPDCGGEWPRKGMQWAWDATHSAGPASTSDLSVDQGREHRTVSE